MGIKNLHDDVDAVKDIVKRTKNPEAEEAIIVSVAKPFCKVQTKGSVQFKTIRCDSNPDVEVGKRCLIQRLPKSPKYVILSVFSNNTLTNNKANNAFELFPPSNISVSGNIPGIISVKWDSPPQQPVVFEVQTNTSAIDSGAVQVALNRGSELQISSLVPLYIRIRSVAADFHTSSWSSWYPATPGAAAATGWFSQLKVIDTPQVIPINCATLIPGSLTILTGGSVETDGELWIIT